MTDAGDSAGNSLSEYKHDLAHLMTDLHFERHPELEKRYGEKGRKKCYEDAIYHLDYLEQAVRFNSSSLFSNYLHWARTMLSERNIPEEDLFDTIKCMKEAVRQKLPGDEAALLTSYIDNGLESLENRQRAGHTFLKPGAPLLDEARRYLDLLLSGKRKEAAELIEGLVEDGTLIRDIYEHIFQQTQYEIGVLWQTNQITVAHEHYCTAATQLIMSQLYPKIFASDKTGRQLVACSVAEELHEIGIRMVADFFEMEGWDTYYMGANMPANHLISTLKEYNADLLAISVTMPIHLGRAESLISEIRSDEEVADIKILVGGYPFRIEPDLWKKVGADGSAVSAKKAVEIATELVEK